MKTVRFLRLGDWEKKEKEVSEFELDSECERL